MSVKESHGILVAQESDKMIEEDKIIKEAKKQLKKMELFFLMRLTKFQLEVIGSVVMFREKEFKGIYYH